MSDESDDEWRFSVDEFEDSSHAADSSARRDSAADGRAVDGTADDPEDPEAGNVAGEFAPEVPVVPEMPALENAAFITLGAILAVLAFASVVGGTDFSAIDALLIVAVVGGLGAATYGALVRLTPDT